MKHLILLLALVLPLTGQTLTNTTLDGVTNATINGKLDDDVSATHAALNLGTAATTTTPVFHVADYGALGDTRIVTDAIMTASSATLTSATAVFVNAPAASGGDVGKFIEVLGAGTSGATLHATINSVTNGTTVVLSASAATTTVAARTITSVSTTLGSRNLTCAGGAFTNADLGKALISTTSYPVETRITAILSGTQVEMSRPAAGTSAAQTIVVPGATAAFGTDDTDAIQDALEAAKSAGGGIVQLGKGTYFVNATSLPVGATHGHCIKVHSNTTLQGVGMGASVIRAMSNQSNCPVVFGSGNVFGVGGTDYYTRMQNVTIRDLTVDGNKYLKPLYSGTGAGATSGEDEGVNFYGIDGLTITNCEIRNALADGIDLDGVGEDCTDILFHGLTIIGNDINGMHLEADNLRVIGCHFENNAADYSRSNLATNPDGAAFESRQGDVRTMAGCTFLHNDVDISATTIVISGCSFQNGISPVASVNCEINGPVTLRNCAWNIYGPVPAAVLVNIASATNAVFISDCTISSGSRGIDVTSGREIYVTGTFMNCQLDAIRLTNLNSGLARIVGNPSIYSVSGNAVRVDASAPVHVVGNTLGCASAYVIDFRATGSHVAKGNTLLTSSLSIRCTSSTGNLIQENQMAGSLQLSAANTSVIGNRVGSISIDGSGSSGVFVNNTVTGTFSITSSSAVSNLFERNVITGAITLSGGATINGSGTWRGNTGSGCAGVFYGSGTLASGTLSVNTIAANSARKWSITRQAPNASTGIGSLSIGTINAQTNFAINALNATATVETGDLSTVYWEILE